MATTFLELGPKSASVTILLAHGAGAPMHPPDASDRTRTQKEFDGVYDLLLASGCHRLS